MNNTKATSLKMTFDQRLDKIIQLRPGSIYVFVAQEILEDGDSPEAYVMDLQQFGCVSGMIGSLTYYNDTHQFFDRFYDEIEELRADYEESIGEPISIKNDLKNFLAWFGFEVAADKIYYARKENQMEDFIHQQLTL